MGGALGWLAGAVRALAALLFAFVVGWHSRTLAEEVGGCALRSSAGASGGLLLTPTRLAAHQGVRLSDGSSACVFSELGTVSVLRDDSLPLVLALQSGFAHFEVPSNTTRTWVVTAGVVRITAVGTTFDVEQDHDRVRIAVHEGELRIETPSATSSMHECESVWIDSKGSEVSSRSAAIDLAPAAGNADPAPPMAAGRADANYDTSSIGAMEARGEHDPAAQRLFEAGPSAGIEVGNDPAALMDAADVARLSNHPEASVGYLTRVLHDYASSPVAPLAAFTLGRVLLERLGQPSAAAQAFAVARSSAPQGSLAEDALAREVEALSKARRSHEAYERAQWYVQLYPSARRLRAVQLYGAFECGAKLKSQSALATGEHSSVRTQ